MHYENRPPTEGINVTQSNPLVQFVKLGVTAVVLVVLLMVVLQVSGGWVAKRVPFSFELRVMQELDVDFGHNSEHPQMANYLNELAQKVSLSMDLPDTFEFTVHYNNQDVFNAFATIGGNLMFYKGLLEDMPNENTLAMVMAHEIAHVVHRDPVASLGGGVASTLALLAFTGSTGSNIAGSVLGNAGTVTSVQFTRGMEQSADELAVTALRNVYGHLNGATQLFQMFSDARGPESQASTLLDGFLSTHPLDENRVLAVQKRAGLEGWSLEGELTPLPDGFASWL